MNIIKCLKFYSLPLLSSVLIGTSYIPFPPWALFFCYVPLWLFTLRQNRLKPLLTGAWLCQFVTSVIGFNWVFYTIREFGFFPWPLSVMGLLIFASFANLHIPIVLYFWFISQKKLKKIKNSSLRFFCILILLPLYSALGMEYYPMIFEWNFGYTWFYAKWPASQTAEIWGFKFLNTLSLFFNLLSLYIYFSLAPKIRSGSIRVIKTALCKKIISLFPKRSLSFIRNTQTSFIRSNAEIDNHIATPSVRASLWILAIWTLFFAGLNFYGQYLKNRWPQPNRTARVLIVQPNIKNLNKLYKESKIDPRPAVLSQLIKKTEKYFKNTSFSTPEEETRTRSSQTSYQTAEKQLNHRRLQKAKLDFILWPEGTYPYSIKHDTKKTTGSFAQRQARKWNTSIMLSATGKSPRGTTNSIFTFNNNGELIQAPYDKTLLLAFGEYLPGEQWFPVEKLFSYYGRSFARGTGENKVIKLNEMNVGLQICYEGLFDFFTRDLSLEKAQIIVNVTNDSWYGSWQQPWQHLYMTLSRAIEVRRPLVRGTNTGFSAFISAKGEIGPISTLNKSMSWVQEIPYNSRKKYTVFTLWGYYINQYFLWGLLLIVFGLFCLTNKKESP